MVTEKLISEIYAAASGRVAWETPLETMASVLDLWGVQIIGIDKRHGGILFTEEGGPARAAALDYLRFFHRSNPRIGPSMATPADQWMHCHEHFDDAYVSTSPFYQDFLIPHGGRYLSSTKLIDDEETVFLFGVFRGYGSSPIIPVDMPLLMQLKHHLSEALRNFVHLREAYAELGMARKLLAQFDYAMLMVDESRGIWHRNDRAAELLNLGDTVFDKAGFLVCSHPASNDLLTEAIRSLRLSDPQRTRDPVNASRSSRRVVSIPRARNGPLLAFVSAVYPDDAMGAFGHIARALIILHEPATAQFALDPLIVAECFDLTPAEARVAVAIADGASVKQISQKTGAALSTVRTQLKCVLEKVGVNRQADLVRVVLSLPTRNSL